MKVFDLFKKKMKDPVRGTAQVVGVSGPPTRALSGTCRLTLVVEAPGVPATTVRHRDLIVLTSKWPFPGAILPIEIDRSDPTRIDVLWGEVASGAEQAEAQADALAAAMRGDGVPGPAATPGEATAPPGAQDVEDRIRQMFPGATVSVQTTDLTGDPQAAGDVVRGIEEAMGQDLDGDGVIGPTAAATAAASPGDARITQLERLAKLKESGALSDEELAAEKQRLLGEA